MDIRIKFVSSPVAGWNHSDPLTNTPIADLINFTTSAATGISLTRALSGTGGSTNIGAGGSAGSGNAAWVNDGKITGDLVLFNPGSTLTDVYAGLDNAKTYTFEAFGINSSGSNILTASVNGGAAQTMPTAGNLTETIKFTGISPVTGQITAVLGGGAGTEYLGATRLLEETALPGPAITLTQTELTPGGPISGTYADYATVPTTLTVSDGTNTISSAGASPKITGLVIDDTAKTFTATVADLPPTGSAPSILFGTVTVELT